MSSKNKNNHFLIQGSILAAASILVRIIGLIYRIPMNRIIGLEGVGYYGKAFEVYNIALILSSYSLPIAVSRLVSARRVQKQHKNSYRIFLCAMGFAISVGLIASIVIFIGADFLAVAFFKTPNVALPLRILAPTIFVFSIMGVLRGFYQGKSTMIPTAVSQVLEQLVNAVVSIAASYILVSNFSANSNVSAYGAAGGTLGTFVGAVIGLLFLLFVFAVYKPVLNKQMRHDQTADIESYGSIVKLLAITIAPIMDIWGFTDSNYRVPAAGEIQTVLPLVDWKQIKLDAANLTVELPVAGMALDLGGIAKGYASDRVQAIMHGYDVTSALISLGGNVAVFGPKADGSLWKIAISDPNAPDSYIGVLKATDVSVITSGGYERNFVQDGVTYIHIMDPASGSPVKSDLLSVSIISPDGVQGDSLSTALFVMGKDKAIAYWQANRDFACILVTATGEVFASSELKNTFALTDTKGSLTFFE